ncbi:MAG: hypothetical protein CMN85_05975 [Spongiibacteraceae bacterium]|nr:hypothetical protein [Spongiibacteraceae bacterium]
MQPLFCYGTLMYRPLLEFLTAQNLLSQEACLAGYRCLGVKREDYPAIEACEGGLVKGLLVRSIPPAAWQRLDRYEGEMYRRTSVQVQLACGDSEDAWTYVIRPRYSARLARREWQYCSRAEAYAKTQLEVMAGAVGEKR